MLIKLINTDSRWYQQERELRNKILLRPIGIPDYGWEKYDSIAWHFVALDNNLVVGCVLLVPLDEGKKKAQLMQMAVDTAYQKSGIGSFLVKELLLFSKKEMIKEIQIHSRSDVVKFYENFGFEVYGNSFTEVGIEHRYLKKII